MANTPREQFRRLAIGTVAACFTMLLLWLTSSFDSQFWFYGLCLGLAISICYAIPGYIGIWLWRMKHVFFNDTAKFKDPKNQYRE